MQCQHTGQIGSHAVDLPWFYFRATLRRWQDPTEIPYLVGCPLISWGSRTIDITSFPHALNVPHPLSCQREVRCQRLAPLGGFGTLDGDKSDRRAGESSRRGKYTHQDHNGLQWPLSTSLTNSWRLSLQSTQKIIPVFLEGFAQMGLIYPGE